MMKKNNGFTLIEMMVVIVIMMVILGAVGWNYVRLRDRNAVEAAARTVRGALNQAKNYAKIGQWSITPDDWCYPGNLIGTATSPTSNNGVGVEQAGPGGTLAANDFLNGYKHDLQVIAQKGLVMENYGVFWGVGGEANRVETRILCKRRASTSADGMGAWGANFGMNKVKPYHYAYDVMRVEYFAKGVSVLKPNTGLMGVEFTPLYLGVRAPLINGEVNFGDTSCFGEATNEIVVGDEDKRYLYKIPVGMAGDVGEGCFCERGIISTDNLEANGCITPDPANPHAGPCANTCNNIE